MRESFLELAVCPSCGESLTLAATRAEGAEIIEGSLACQGCEQRFPIRGGVPRLLRRPPAGVQEATASAFGWQWNKFPELLPFDDQREQFLDWVAPLQPADFSGKVVVDAGCGMGRLSEIAASFAPKHLIAADVSSAVDVAWRRLRGRDDVHVVQADLCELPLRRGPDAQVDLAYSVGVLHHLEFPQKGFTSVLQHIRRGGRFHAWVYGEEGNAWIQNFVDPVRTRLSSNLPRGVLYGLSCALTVPLHATARVVNRMPFGEQLPYGPYLSWLGRYPFHHNLHIVVDHLGPPVAHYISQDELRRWIAEAPVREVAITRRNANSWRLLVERVE